MKLYIFKCRRSTENGSRMLIINGIMRMHLEETALVHCLMIDDCIRIEHTDRDLPPRLLRLESTAFMPTTVAQSLAQPPWIFQVGS